MKEESLSQKNGLLSQLGDQIRGLFRGFGRQIEQEGRAVRREEVKEGEECDGYAKLEDLVAKCIAGNHPTKAIEMEYVSITDLLVQISIVLNQIEAEIRAQQHQLFLRDDRTPGGPQD